MVELRVDRIVEPGGIEASRELVMHPGSVVVLPVFPDGRVILVRQFRYAAQRTLWELVAGGLEPREKPFQAAGRELQEETGYRARRFKPLFSFFPSPGILAERMHLVMAQDLTPGEARPEEDERLEVRIFKRAELAKKLREKKIEDAKTLIGLMWLFRHGL
ncbi:MAG TPA: NUDIX hydrolase [Terriglobia bacterium]|nr:NUDIX hydrolase [Terriglobia bacterium]